MWGLRAAVVGLGLRNCSVTSAAVFYHLHISVRCRLLARPAFARMDASGARIREPVLRRRFAKTTSHNRVCIIVQQLQLRVGLHLARWSKGRGRGRDDRLHANSS